MLPWNQKGNSITVSMVLEWWSAEMNAEELEKIVTRHETPSLETTCAFTKPVANVKIVSGGQTGVDRGAL